jgi:hypothetical protein
MSNQPLDAAFAARQDNRKKSSRRIVVLGALFVGLAGTAASVYAANININSSTDISFAQGVEDVAACSADATTDIASTFNPAAGGSFAVSSVTVATLADACRGLSMDVYLTDGTNVLGQKLNVTVATGTSGDNSTVVSEFLDTNGNGVTVDAALVTDVAVEIRG